MSVKTIEKRDSKYDKRYEEIEKEWDKEKNGDLSLKDLAPSSRVKVWWKCEEGHEWEAAVKSRVIGKTNCPYCAGQKASEDNCLATVNPEVAKEWHPTKNGDLTPHDVTKGSNRKVWWMCKEGHEWEARVNIRVSVRDGREKGTGCPYCSGRAVCEDNCLATLNPELAKEWHPTKNGDLTPHDVTLGTNRKVWWKCKEGHEWEARVSDRTSGIGCPYCAGQRVSGDNCLAATHPELVKEWHPTKNGDITPHDITSGTNKKAWWKCDKGHEWEARVSDRSHGSKCPYCAGQRVSEDNCLATLRPDLVKYWHPTKNGDLTPHDVTVSSSKLVWWKCDEGHEWQSKVRNRSKAKTNKCPECRKSKKEKVCD